jgi:small conductance mechanosensitive channel
MQEFLQSRFGVIFSRFLFLVFDALAILIIGIIVLRLVDSALKRVKSIVPPSDLAGARRVEQRAETLRQIVRSVGKVFLGAVLMLIVANDVGIQTGPLLASAGIVGLAIGFGAQSLVKDVIAGFFIILEDQYGVGDVVRIGTQDGTVEEMTLRVTVLRNFEGQVHIIPNGNIQNVTVLTKDWSRAVIDLPVSHKEDLGRVNNILTRINEKLASDMPDKVFDKPQILGIERLTEEGVTLRLAVKTPPGKQGDVLHEWRKRIKEAFQREGIEMPQRLGQLMGKEEK